MDEPALIHDAQKGDLTAFNRLVLAYQDMVYNQAYRILNETDAAEDATQDAFIAAYRKISTFRGGSFRAWLLRIVTNLCYDELRRRKRRPTTSLQPLDADNEEIESPKWLEDNGESPEEATARGELRKALENCLKTLPIEFKTVVILVDIQGLDYAEASQAIGKPLGTIKSRLARARTRLRICLSSYRELLPKAFRLMSEI